MNNNKNINSIFENCHETSSQEIFLRSCGFAQRGVPPDSDPSVGISSPLSDGIASHPETDDVIASDLVDSHAIRFVSPPESVDTVDVEEDVADRTAPVESKVDVEEDAADRTAPVESKVDVDEDAADRTVPVESKVDEEVALEKSGDLLFSDQPSSSSVNRGDERLESPAKKLKIPLRDVVKAIVMNSRNVDEDKEIEKMSYVQILMKKGFKF